MRIVDTWGVGELLMMGSVAIVGVAVGYAVASLVTAHVIARRLRKGQES